MRRNDFTRLPKPESSKQTINAKIRSSPIKDCSRYGSKSGRFLSSIYHITCHTEVFFDRSKVIEGRGSMLAKFLNAIFGIENFEKKRGCMFPVLLFAFPYAGLGRRATELSSNPKFFQSPPQ